MKKSILILFSLFFLQSAFAQIPPQQFNYSAVARNPNGEPIANSTLGIQITIIKDSINGAIQYTENHTVNTDAFGLFNLVIGEGNVQSGNMAFVDWTFYYHFLKVGMDATGGTNFVTMGTSKFLSVPYAMHARSAEFLVGGTGAFTHYIGEQFGGGVVFHVWKDSLGVEHGLIVDKNNLSNNAVWSNISTVEIGPTAQSSWDGLSNSIAITTQANHSNSAAALCLNSSNSNYFDWYLPSIYELQTLNNNIIDVDRSLSQLAGSTQIGFNTFYWSSTEFIGSGYFAYIMQMGGTFGSRYKDGTDTGTRAVRAIRAF
jgi:hypothetical protein